MLQRLIKKNESMGSVKVLNTKKCCIFKYGWARGMELCSQWQAVDAGAAWIMLWITPGEKLAVRHKDTDQGVKLKIHPAATPCSDLGLLTNYFST